MIGFFLSLALLILVSAIQPRRSKLSSFELERRKQLGNQAAALELEREQTLSSVVTLKAIIVSLLVAAFALLSVLAFGPIVGLPVAVAGVIFFIPAARTEQMRSLAEKMYLPYDEAVITFLKRHTTLANFLAQSVPVRFDPTLSSREELEHAIEDSQGILSNDEKKLLLNGLHFPEKTVESIMTPRGVVESINKSELIGPLLLDELHKTGHSRFPVIDGDIDHVVGVLHIRELLALGNKASQTAAEAMEKKVYFINQDQSLKSALSAFLKTRHHLFVVVNGYRETAGIVTLEDVIEALLGQKIVDEFDLHDDLRAVAERSARKNNNTAKGVDL